MIPKYLANGTAGLINEKNNCYINSVLQSLSNTEILTKTLLNNDITEHLNPINTKTGGSLLGLYWYFLEKVWFKEVKEYDPDPIKKVIGLEVA